MNHKVRQNPAGNPRQAIGFRMISGLFYKSIYSLQDAALKLNIDSEYINRFVQSRVNTKEAAIKKAIRCQTASC